MKSKFLWCLKLDFSDDIYYGFITAKNEGEAKEALRKWARDTFDEDCEHIDVTRMHKEDTFQDCSFQ